MSETAVIVEIAGTRRAIASERVLEIATLENLTPVPTAPAKVCGLTQSRGQILPVLDLGAPARSAIGRPRYVRIGSPLLVVEVEVADAERRGAVRALVGLAVDHVHPSLPRDEVDSLLIDVDAEATAVRRSFAPAAEPEPPVHR